ncbi:uroporphyrinogen-III synthase-like [Antedon mediterranea]|uniref:uroporphyrinogen-III synthase-like n=1 Tax=Antedon mediterranea TaxID=105859 RepID=UPI003AF6A670
MKKVLLLKAAKGNIEDDIYVQTLTSEGLSPTLIQVLSFKFFNLDQFYKQISNPDNYGGIVFSSPRSVEAFTKAIESNSSIQDWKSEFLPKWLPLPAYVVGNATAEHVKQLGLVPVGADSGNAQNLVQVIKKGTLPGGLPLVFPCGNLRRETIPSSLDEEGIKFESLTVYESMAHPMINESLSNFIQNQGVPDYIVFFSPSGVRFSHQSVLSCITAIDRVQMIAIGPTTKVAMEKIGYVVAGVAESPDSESLINILRR